jgi:hypothetical protein
MLRSVAEKPIAGHAQVTSGAPAFSGTGLLYSAISARPCRLQLIEPEVPMATTIRITLLSGTYGQPIAVPAADGQESLQLDYPPSPQPLLYTLLLTHIQLEPVLSRLQASLPEYHLPYGQVEGARHSRSPLRRTIASHRDQRHPSSGRGPTPLRLGEGAELHLRWPVDLSAEEERLLNAVLAEQRCFGRPDDKALWQLVPSMPAPNCRPAVEGTVQLLCSPAAVATSGVPLSAAGGSGWVRYSFEPHREAPQALAGPASLANRAVYGLDGGLALPAAAGIAWTDRLHRALLQRAPGSSLFAGLAAGRPLPEDQRAWYRWESIDGRLVQLEVLSPQPFTAPELDALTGLRWLFGHAGFRVPLRLRQLDALTPPAAACVHTATPMLLYTTPRPGKLQRSPAAQAIQTLLWGVGEEGKIEPERFVPDGPEGGVCLDHPRFGHLRARAWLSREANLVTSRSDRRAASSSGYHAVLAAEKPLPLLAVGWGRHFGAGRLQPCDHQPGVLEHPFRSAAADDALNE